MTLCFLFFSEESANAFFLDWSVKGSEPGGFPARFFQRNWDTLKDGIIRAVKEFFSVDEMLDGVNETSIVLIPKITNPKKVFDFRPISL